MKFLRSYWPWLALFGLLLVYIGYSITFLNLNTYVQNTKMLLKGGLILNLVLFIRKCLQWYSAFMYVGENDFELIVDRPRLFYFSILYVSSIALYFGFPISINFFMGIYPSFSFVLTSLVAAAGAILFGLLAFICSRWFG